MSPISKNKYEFLIIICISIWFGAMAVGWMFVYPKPEWKWDGMPKSFIDEVRIKAGDQIALDLAQYDTSTYYWHFTAEVFIGFTIIYSVMVTILSLYGIYRLKKSQIL